MHLPPGSTLLLAALLVTGTPSLAAQQTAAPPDTARLRHDLAAALAGDFDIVRAELRANTPERAGTFWLAHLQPRRPGAYDLRYTYDYRDRRRPEDPLYTHVEHTSILRIGAAGCARRREGRDACLGDVLVVPIVAGDHAGGFTGHTFEVTRRPEAGDAVAEPEPVAAAPGADTHANPATPHLRYLGTRMVEMPHRNLGSTTTHHADFTAQAPGAFNLSLRPGGPSAAEPAESAGSIPVVVVPRGQPVTVLLENERIRSYHASGRFASNTGNQYLTSVLLLQPGDRISLTYHTTTLRGRIPSPADREAARNLSPVISVHPFQVPARNRFNAWIADHLPPPP